MPRPYQSSAGQDANWITRYFPASVAFLRRQPAAAPMAWALAGFIAALLTGREGILVLALAVSITVMTSRWVAVILNALRQHPRYKRRLALKRSFPTGLAAVVGISCTAAMLGYFRLSWPVAWGLAVTAALLCGYWILVGHGGRLPHVILKNHL